MQLKMQSCQHQRPVVYELLVDSPEQGAFRATCPACYRRLRIEVDFTTGRVVASDDTPAVRCSHTHKKPISEAITRRLPYQDALCWDCGRVLRHPNDRGTWTEVRFYGFVIREEPL